MSWNPRVLFLRVVCLSALVLAAGCFKSLGELTPFPCPSDGVCSADGGDLICLSGQTCVRSEPCDPIAQDCTDPSRPKCAWTASPYKVTDGEIAYAKFQAQCVPVPSPDPANEGEACTRDEALPYEFALGRDTCASGLICSAFLADETRCLRLCRSTSDCAAGSFCARNVWSTHSVCVPTCNVFESCPGRRTCSPAPDVSRKQYFGACTLIADEPVAPGMGCSLDVPDPFTPELKVETPFTLCMPGSACVMLSDVSRCMRMCDADHACNDWGTCVHRDRMPTGVGACECRIGSCPEGLGCQVFGPAGGVFTAMCAPAKGSVGADSPCTSVDQCPKDTVCWGSNNKYHCRHMCDPEHSCPSPQVCEPVEGLDGMGMCDLNCSSGQTACGSSCCDSSTQVCSDGQCVARPECTSNSDCSTRCCSNSSGSARCAPASECGCGTAAIWTVACSSGIYCPQGSTCNSDGKTCHCSSGEAYSCSGEPCSNGECSYPNWWCP